MTVASEQSDRTADRILDAAEQLFADRGVMTVSLREIIREAGVKNASAVQYYFTDRSGVVRAILAKYSRDVDVRRHAMLDHYEAGGRPDLRFLAATLVRPLAANLADQSGRNFLRIYAQLVHQPDIGVVDPDDSSIWRWRSALDPFIAPDAARMHRRYTANTYAMIELARRAAAPPRPDNRLFVSYVIDMVTAILAAGVSDETHRLIVERDTRPADAHQDGGKA